MATQSLQTGKYQGISNLAISNHNGWGSQFTRQTNIGNSWNQVTVGVFYTMGGGSSLTYTGTPSVQEFLSSGDNELIGLYSSASFSTFGPISWYGLNNSGFIGIGKDDAAPTLGISASSWLPYNTGASPQFIGTLYTGSAYDPTASVNYYTSSWAYTGLGSTPYSFPQNGLTSSLGFFAITYRVDNLGSNTPQILQAISMSIYVDSPTASLNGGPITEADIHPLMIYFMDRAKTRSTPPVGFLWSSQFPSTVPYALPDRLLINNSFLNNMFVLVACRVATQYQSPIILGPVSESQHNTSESFSSSYNLTYVMSVNATGSVGSLSYQWQYLPGYYPIVGSWKDLTSSYSYRMTGAQTPLLHWYAHRSDGTGGALRCIVSDAIGSVTSSLYYYYTGEIRGG
jgi:hypothetical protein